MSRYFTSSGWEGDYDYWESSWEEPVSSSVDVADHLPTFTGILDASGKQIMKRPRPIGFGRDKEW